MTTQPACCTACRGAPTHSSWVRYLSLRPVLREPLAVHASAPEPALAHGCPAAVPQLMPSVTDCTPAY
eukprot:365162-Chlamydomonas_euryale.AAC.2